MTPPLLGPAHAATIITKDLDHSIGIYGEHLMLDPHLIGPLSEEASSLLGWPQMEGHRSAWLKNSLGEPWLQFIEHPAARHKPAFQCYGWLSLEISVNDVDALGESLQDSPFEIIGPPADLAMSDAIRAMQVVGPSGEVLYLTQVKRPVPPFQLPVPRCLVDRLFIPVLNAPDRDTALAHYEDLSGNEGLRFDTKITVISRARGYPVDHQHPVATLQLAGNTLIEIDEVADFEPAPFSGPDPPTGIALIHFQHREPITSCVTGAAGERYLLTPTKEGKPS